MSYYDSGATVRLKLTMTDSSGTAVDPGALTFKVRQPDGTVTSYVYGTDAQLVKSSTGIYYVDWPIPKTLAAEGVWSYRFEATGANAGAVESQFTVRNSAFY